MPTPGYVFKDGQPIPDDELEEQSKQPRQETQAKETKDDLSAITRQTSTATSATSPVHTPTSSKSGSSKFVELATDAPTESHALAEADHEEKGAAQEEHFENEVKDLGWNDHPDSVPKPLVGGLQNEDLWLLVRRFDKVCQSISFKQICLLQ